MKNGVHWRESQCVETARGRAILGPTQFVILKTILDSQLEAVPWQEISRLAWGRQANKHTVESMIVKMRQRLTPIGVTIRAGRNRYMPRGYWLEGEPITYSECSGKTGVRASRVIRNAHGSARLSPREVRLLTTLVKAKSQGRTVYELQEIVWPEHDVSRQTVYKALYRFQEKVSVLGFRVVKPIRTGQRSSTPYRLEVAS